VSKKVADKIANDIVDKILLLEQTLSMGQPEKMLAHLKKDTWYLVSGNYKIVYLIDENIATIATVFDCRQNPEKLEKKIF
jgi:toxin ParE1/3/4